MKEFRKGIYKHYKGNYYEVLDIAKHSDANEDMVIYRALYDNFQLYVRPLRAFLETLEINGQPQKRFEFVRDQTQNRIKTHVI